MPIPPDRSWHQPEDKNLVCQMLAVQQLLADDSMSVEVLDEVQAME